MATRKKTKTKSKKAKKKTSARRAAPKKAGRRSSKVAVKKSRKTSAKRSKAVSRAAPKTSSMASAPQPAAPPAGERIGIVTHYYSHLAVAIIKIESGVLREGEVVQIKGHTSDFMQRVESMELDHVHVSEAGPGQSVGLRVKEHAREHDVVYKLAH